MSNQSKRDGVDISALLADEFVAMKYPDALANNELTMLNSMKNVLKRARMNQKELEEILSTKTHTS